MRSANAVIIDVVDPKAVLQDVYPISEEDQRVNGHHLRDVNVRVFLVAHNR